MEISNITNNHYNINSHPEKTNVNNAVFFNTTDAFKPEAADNKPLPDLKKLAEVLFKQEQWENRENGIVFTANSERVILGSYNQVIKAVDPDDGKLLWKSEIKGSVSEGKDKNLLVSSFDNSIIALDPKTGKEVWSKSFKDEIRIFDMADDGTLYAKSKGNVLAINPDTHEIERECPVTGDPVIGKNGMVFGGGPDRNKVTAYDLNTGEQKWEADTAGMVRCAPAVGKDGTVYVGMVVSNSMIALDPETGKEKWSFKTDGGIVQSPVVGKDGTVYVGDCGNPAYLYAVDPETGKEKWRFKGDNDFRNGISFLPDGTIAVPTGTTLNAINPDTGNLRWSKKAKSYIFAPPVAGSAGRLYFGTNGQGMHCIRDSAVFNAQYADSLTEKEAATSANPQITKGEGFVEIGGIRLKVNQ